MSDSSCWPVPLVLNVSPWIVLPMVCSILSPSLPVLGHTSPLILSLGFPHRRVTLWFSRWWIAFLRRFISFPCPSCPLPGRPPSWWWTTSSGSMDCRLMWFQIGVLSSPPGFGRSFVDRSGPRLVCLLVFILRPMGNASGPTRILKECSAVWHPTIRVHGANSSLG